MVEYIVFILMYFYYAFLYMIHRANKYQTRNAFSTIITFTRLKETSILIPSNSFGTMHILTPDWALGTCYQSNKNRSLSGTNKYENSQVFTIFF